MTSHKPAPLLITKSRDWALAKEGRLFLPDSALSTNNPRYKPEQLKRIVFGMNCTKENKKEIGDMDAYELETCETKNYA